MQKLHKPKDWRWLLHRALSIVFSRTVVTVVLVLAQAVRGGPFSHAALAPRHLAAGPHGRP